jgi:DNA (cytosine-5)-methyltransferase 1
VLVNNTNDPWEGDTMTAYDAVDLFAGPGGWDVAARNLGLRTLGIEFDDTAVLTRLAAGHPTIHGDVRDHGPDTISTPGLIASPPCQTFSMAGKGAGRAALDTVSELARAMARREPVDLSAFSDPRTALVLEPLRWALAAIDLGRPYEWLAFEQVPTVLPVWNLYADILRGEGYHVDAGYLHSEQHGVPQTRKRAILVARLGGPVSLPKPTHSRYYPRTPDRLDPGVKPWVSMAEALGFGLPNRPSPTVTGGGTETGGAEPIAKLARYMSDPSWVMRNGSQERSATRPVTHPAPTMIGGHDYAAKGWHQPATGQSVRLTVEEAATLQTFPAGYPWQGGKGKRFLQVGNAVPPKLAEAILAGVARRARIV